MVYDSSIPTHFVRSSIETKVLKSSERFMRVFNNSLLPITEFSNKELLAFELFGASFFERTERTRFLTLMIAIEVMLETEKHNTEVQNHIGKLISATYASSEISDVDRELLINGLSFLLKNSITKTGMMLASKRLKDRKYLDKSSDKFFQYCYNIRSKIVHTGTHLKFDSSNGNITNELERFVSDLLCQPYLDIDND